MQMLYKAADVKKSSINSTKDRDSSVEEPPLKNSIFWYCKNPSTGNVKTTSTNFPLKSGSFTISHKQLLKFSLWKQFAALGYCGWVCCVNTCRKWVRSVHDCLYQFLCFEEALQMFHLPNSGADQDYSLGNTPPEHSLVCRFAGKSEAFFSVALVVLLFLDLLDLV